MKRNGRPAKYASGRTVRVNLSLSKEAIEALNDLGILRVKSASEVVNTLICRARVALSDAENALLSQIKASKERTA